MFRCPFGMASFISTSVGHSKRYFHESWQHTEREFFQEYPINKYHLHRD